MNYHLYRIGCAIFGEDVIAEKSEELVADMILRSHWRDISEIHDIMNPIGEDLYNNFSEEETNIKPFGMSLNKHTVEALIKLYKEEISHQQDTIISQGKKLSEVINIVRGSSPENTWWSVHDVVEHTRNMKNELETLRKKLNEQA